MTAKLTNLLGIPIEQGLELLPADWRQRVNAATREALMVALKAAVRTLNPEVGEAYPRWHKLAVTPVYANSRNDRYDGG